MDPEEAYYGAHARLSRLFTRLFSDNMRRLIETTFICSTIVLLLVLGYMHSSFVGQPGCASEFSSVDFSNSHLIEIKITGVWNDVGEEFLLEFQKHSSLPRVLLREFEFLWNSGSKNQTKNSNSSKIETTEIQANSNDIEAFSRNTCSENSDASDSEMEFQTHNDNECEISETEFQFLSKEFWCVKQLRSTWNKYFQWKNISSLIFNASRKYCVFYGSLLRTYYATFKITVKKFWGTEETSMNNPLGLFWRMKILFFDYFNILDDALKHFAVDPTYLFSTEKGYIILSDSAKNKINLNISKVFISAQSKCFGGPWKRMLIDYFVGYDTIIMNSIIQVKGKERGYLYNTQTKELYTLDYNNEAKINNELKTLYSSKFGVFVTSLFIYFTTTTSISFTLRQTQSQMLIFTALLQHNARNGLPTFHLFFSHICTLFIFVPMMIGVLFFLFEFYNDQFLAFLFFSLIWICELFSMISMQTEISRFFFPKFVFLYVMLFNIYIFSFNHGFTYLAFCTCFVFIHHLIYCFWKYFEFPALARQRSESFDHETEQTDESGNERPETNDGGSEILYRHSYLMQSIFARLRSVMDPYRRWRFNSQESSVERDPTSELSSGIRPENAQPQSVSASEIEPSTLMILNPEMRSNELEEYRNEASVLHNQNINCGSHVVTDRVVGDKDRKNDESGKNNNAEACCCSSGINKRMSYSLVHGDEDESGIRVSGIRNGNHSITDNMHKSH